MMAEAHDLLREAEEIRNLGLNWLRYQEGYSLRELATRFGVSKTTVATVTG